MKTLLLASIFFATSGFAEVCVHYHPYDDTESVTYQLPVAPEKSELRVAQPRIVPAFLCGAYHGQFDFTAGFTLHVFPDKNAMVEEWIDIGLPKLVAEGRWSINAKGEVVFDWKKKNFRGGRSEKFFREKYGECRKMKLFLCFSDKAVENVILVSEEMIGPKIEHAYWRRTEYVDWEKIQNDLKKKNG